MRYVIVGYGIAGVSAVREIKHQDPEGRVVVITPEPLPPYYRPLITLLIHSPETPIELDEEDAGAEFFTDRAVALRPEEKVVVLASGRKVHYDRLLIATGGVPYIPPVEDLPSQGVFTIRNREDALAIGRYSERCKSAAVIGGGLVGIKTAEALQKRGLEVNVVETMEEILHGRLDKKGTGIIRHRLEEMGIKIYTTQTVNRVITREGAPRELILSSGKRIEADMIVIATGIRASIEWMSDSGIKVSRGIVVDEYMRTTIEDIYAAGDVVEFPDLLTGSSLVSGLWINALQMGRVAGSNMAGGSSRYPGALSVMNAAEIVDIPFISAGIIEPSNGLELIERQRPAYRRFIFEDDVLRGIVFLENVERAGLYINLIRSGRRLGRLKEKAIEGVLSYADLWGQDSRH